MPRPSVGEVRRKCVDDWRLSLRVTRRRRRTRARHVTRRSSRRLDQSPVRRAHTPEFFDVALTGTGRGDLHGSGETIEVLWSLSSRYGRGRIWPNLIWPTLPGQIWATFSNHFWWCFGQMWRSRNFDHLSFFPLGGLLVDLWPRFEANPQVRVWGSLASF